VKNEKNPYLKAVGDKFEVTPAGRDFLDNIVTDSTGPVYAFRAKASPLMTAAAMARLSRRGSDLRETYLDEFAMAGEKDASGLIHRVVTAYGDDSVQQLVGLHLVVEDASNLLTKKLEWGRFASYLEQSTRYIYEKDSKGKYRYYVPENFTPKITKHYVKINDQIFDIYSQMVRKLTDHVRKMNPEPEEKREKIAWRGATKAQACDAIRPVLPVSTKATVGIFASAQAAESLIMHLLSEDLIEARMVGQRMLEEARKVMPAFFERADKADRGGAMTAFLAAKRGKVKKTAENLGSNEQLVKENSVSLLDFWPKKELDVVPHLLFADSNLSTSELQNKISKMTDNQKGKILEDYMGTRLNRRHKPGRALEIPHYFWEVVADYGTFRDLQRHRVIDAFEWQRLRTDYGYDIPDLVKEAGLKKDFKACFELSEQLVKTLLAVGFEEEAQYATLFGHRMRYRFMLNARAAFHFIELRSSPQGHPGYRKIVTQMHQQLAKVHPRIASAMKFVNKDEDPELTRMAAELATQYKLEKLSAKSPNAD
jgi:thymidylate synthase ThyX